MGKILYLPQQKTRSMLGTVIGSVIVVFLFYILHLMNDGALILTTASQKDAVSQSASIPALPEIAPPDNSVEIATFLSTIQTAQEASRQLLRTPADSLLSQAVERHWAMLSTQDIDAAAEPEVLYEACLHAPPAVRLEHVRCSAYADAIEAYIINNAR